MNFASLRTPALATLIAAGSLLLGAVPAGADSGGSQCHGKAVTVHGTDGDDVLKAEDVSSGDVIALGDGDDYIYLEGDDRVTVCGGLGEDNLMAGPDAGRHLVLDGEEGRDNVGSAFYNQGGKKVAKYAMKLYGGDAYDAVTGSLGDDELHGGNSGDFVLGNSGDDVIIGASGGDQLAGEAGADKIYGGRGDDNLSGGRDFGKKSDRGDLTDGGEGRDYCNGRKERNCERKTPTV